ncbi:MAG TPA: ChbG/HpnK family deacetylase, partial [Patescibacteria group bacterium]|nr:ChbG/HpnK family deacetylase [Patescibacteria group bacterium]
INADDFGLHPAVNQAVALGFSAGCITSTSLMAGAPAFEEAVDIAGTHLGLGVGVHLTLVAGQPVLDPALVPSLVDREGQFATAYPLFLQHVLTGKVKMVEVQRELQAQVKKIRDAGIAITHLDSHQHMHVVPGILAVVLDLAREFDVRALRIPQEPFFFTGGCSAGLGRLTGRGGLSMLAGLARRKLRQRGVATTDHFFGMLAGGQLKEELLLNILAVLPDGISEIMLHPGADNQALGAMYPWNYRWESELAAVTGEAVGALLERRKIQLVSFREVAC